MDCAVKWNKLDTVIAFCEDKCRELKQAYRDSADEEPDPEEMILAATEQLRIENESLKRRETPLYLRQNGAARYYCPAYGCEVSDPAYRYCPDCGHRIMRHISPPYEV